MTLATFEIKGTFKLTGRGLVIYGDVLNGTVSKENFISFHDGKQEIKLKIRSVEMLDYREEKRADVGLLFYYNSDEQRTLLETLQVARQTASVTEE